MLFFDTNKLHYHIINNSIHTFVKVHNNAYYKYIITMKF